MAAILGRRTGDTYILPVPNSKYVSRFWVGSTPLTINRGGILGYSTGDATVKSRLVIYSSAGGTAPTTLLATSNELVGMSADTNAYTFPAPVTLQANSHYYIGIILDRSVPIASAVTSIASHYNANLYASGPSTTFGSTSTFLTELVVWVMEAAAELVVGKAGAVAVLESAPVFLTESAALSDPSRAVVRSALTTAETADASIELDAEYSGLPRRTIAERVSATDAYPSSGAGWRYGTVSEAVQASEASSTSIRTGRTLAESAPATVVADVRSTPFLVALSESVSAQVPPATALVRKGALASDSADLRDYADSSAVKHAEAKGEDVSASDEWGETYLDALIFNPTSTTTLTGLTTPPVQLPVAILTATSDYTVVGAVVTMDGRGSIDPDDQGLTYTFSFISVPIGSKVPLEGFRKLDGSGGSVSFSPDVVGLYTVGLVVSNTNFDSEAAQFTIDVRAMLVPHARGMVPDGKFIWSYLRDVWTQVEGKDFFETLWSALIQISGSDLLRLYQNDFNKSIADIQEEYQRRWLSYEPKLALVPEDCSFYMGGEQVGISAATKTSSTGVTDTILVTPEEGAGILALAPGRIIVVGGEARTVTRVVEQAQNVSAPAFGIVTANTDIPAGQSGQIWRVPYSLHSTSQNFEELGVRAGDAFIASVADDSGIAVDVLLQVVGVDGQTLGFVLSPEDLDATTIPSVPAGTVLSVSDRFGIKTTVLLPDGTVAYQDEALSLLNSLLRNDGTFRKTCWNTKLTSTDPIPVGPRTFYLIPKAVIRNRMVPVDATVRSIPALQEYIRQPEVKEEDGRTYIVRNGQRTEVARLPQALYENQGYVVDGEEALSGTLSFRTGVDLIDADCGDFVDRGITAGDIFKIETPYPIAGEYTITAVLSRNRLKLSKKVPLNPTSDYVVANVKVLRKTAGHFIRFIPGYYSAKNPAPSRFWAEVTFFDNNENVERNFGILVGLTRDSIDSLAASATYRQAVAGLMYAYTSGGAVDQVRLGASLLLGLPFTEKRGIIRAVDPDYRLDVGGVPIQGRILIEDLDEAGALTGLMRIYTFPVDAVPNSTLSGIDTNPKTGKPYAVGDVVEAFSQLAKGVDVQDYLSDSAGAFGGLRLLQQYHSVRVRINDNIFRPKEMELVATFLRRITPSYVALAISSASEVGDDIDISDKLKGKLGPATVFSPTPFLEFVGANFAAQPSLDAKSWEGIPMMLWDEPPYELRRVGRTWRVSKEGEGQHWRRVTLPEGGLVDPRITENFDAPLCENTDWLLVVSEEETRLFKDISIINDTTVYLNYGSPPDEILPTHKDDDGELVPPGPLFAAIVRPLTGALPRWFDTASVSQEVATDNGENYDYSIVTLDSGGLRSIGVATGDWLLHGDLESPGIPTTVTRHTVLGVTSEHEPYNSVAVTPPILTLKPKVGFWKPQLLTYPAAEAQITVEGGTTIGPTSVMSFEILRALADPGDFLEFEGEITPYVFLDPVQGLVDYELPTGNLNVILRKKSTTEESTVSGLRMGPRCITPGITDLIAIKIQPGATIPNSIVLPASDVLLGLNPVTLGVRIGDFFRPLTYRDTNTTRDVGYGPGTYPIVGVSGTTIDLTVSLTAGSTAWEILRRV